jgi:hypothetical protein
MVLVEMVCMVVTDTEVPLLLQILAMVVAVPMDLVDQEQVLVVLV